MNLPENFFKIALLRSENDKFLQCPLEALKESLDDMVVSEKVERESDGAEIRDVVWTLDYVSCTSVLHASVTLRPNHGFAVCIRMIENTDKEESLYSTTYPHSWRHGFLEDADVELLSRLAS